MLHPELLRPRFKKKTLSVPDSTTGIVQSIESLCKKKQTNRR